MFDSNSAFFFFSTTTISWLILAFLLRRSCTSQTFQVLFLMEDKNTSTVLILTPALEHVWETHDPEGANNVPPIDLCPYKNAATNFGWYLEALDNFFWWNFSSRLNEVIYQKCWHIWPKGTELRWFCLLIWVLLRINDEVILHPELRSLCLISSVTREKLNKTLIALENVFSRLCHQTWATFNRLKPGSHFTPLQGRIGWDNKGQQSLKFWWKRSDTGNSLRFLARKIRPFRLEIRTLLSFVGPSYPILSRCEPGFRLQRSWKIKDRHF